MAAAGFAGAFTTEGDAWLENLRDRIAMGRGGEEAYQQAVRTLSADPESGCDDWLQGGEADAADDPDLEASLREVCPEDSASESPWARRPFRRRGGPALDLSASQSAYPRKEREEGPAPALWSAQGRDAGAALEVSGRGGDLRRRSAGFARGGFAAQAGHLGRFLEATRIPAVAGNTSYAGEGASTGISGPLASAYPGLDGLALSARSGPWRAQAAGAWNRLAGAPMQGNLPVTVRRDAGLFAAGLAHAPAAGPEMRAQALVLRLETGSAPPTWLTVAGAQASARTGSWAGRAGAAVSAGPGREADGRFGGYVEGALGYSDREDTLDAGMDPVSAGGRLRVRQAFREWANPLQSPRGSLQDTVGGWATEAPGAGGARAESGFPLGRRGGYAAGVLTTAAADWAGAGADADAAEAGLMAGRGEAVLIQSYGPCVWTVGAGWGWRRPGSGAPPVGGWGLGWEWHRGAWRATADLSRRGSDYAGSRPMPLELSLARGTVGGCEGSTWKAAWSTADVRRPDREQRLDLRQTWPGGTGLRIEQRVRLPWTPDGIAGDLAYQLGMAAEF